jgi:adapter protein MecA 1/2
MRIEKINNNKIKIMFDATELEENNITIHSFLSGSLEAQRLVYAILDIANEEFGFDTENCNISSETISFSNKNFVIIVTKSSSLSFLPPIIDECSLNSVVYKFSYIEEFFSFCKYINSYANFWSVLENSLYKYKNEFILIMELKNLEKNLKRILLSILAEYKNYILLSPLALTELKEHSILILENKAIQAI